MVGYREQIFQALIVFFLLGNGSYTFQCYMYNIIILSIESKAKVYQVLFEVILLLNVSRGVRIASETEFLNTQCTIHRTPCTSMYIFTKKIESYSRNFAYTRLNFNYNAYCTLCPRKLNLTGFSLNILFDILYIHMHVLSNICM